MFPSHDRGIKFKKPKPGSYDYQLEQTMKPGYRKEMKKGGKALKPVDKQKNPGLAKLDFFVCLQVLMLCRLF